ncbi:MAG: phosphocholine cytidylyltransferase family protein [Holosporales bacterium]|jgi:choline kinase|nr:phosphocholine cytidylyltransferase family protein [Holosporales bacterium]
MKAVILAAGVGRRLSKYTRDLPKGMLSFKGKALIEHQLDALRAFGISDIAIVTGYKSQKINFSNVTYFHNKNFSSTNMLESFLCAREFFTDDLIISYSDIVYTPALVDNLCSADCDIGAAVDSDWKKLWKLRYGDTENDLEILHVNQNLYVTEIGRKTDSSVGLNYRYIGLLKFSIRGIDTFLTVYENRLGQTWPQSGKDFKNGYMTDILAQMISEKYKVKAISSKGGWLEFDTNEDYEIITKAYQLGKISNQYVING